MEEKFKAGPSLLDILFSSPTMNAAFRRVLRGLVWLLGLLLAPGIALVSFLHKNKSVPPPNNKLLDLSATQLAQMIRTKQVSCEQVVLAFVSRCKEVNPIINAVVEPRYELALQEARNVDALIAKGEYSISQLESQYPLLGVPITVKESIAVTGMSHAAGRVLPARRVAQQDAACISQARAAGAIPLLVSNTPELCKNWETFNQVTGVTRNPHSTKHTPGGSSGGEAALLSSGASVLGVGSDIAGSLRLPAMFTGVFGHKPTPCAVSTQGHLPQSSDPTWTRYFTLGPMARHAEDLSLLLKVLKDPAGPKLQLEKKVSMKELRFFYMEGDSSGVTTPINKDMRRVLRKVMQHFKHKHDITVIKTQMKNMDTCFDSSLYCLLRLNGIETIYSTPGDPDSWRPIWPEILKKMVGLSKSNLTSIMYGPLKKLGDFFGEDKYIQMDQLNNSLKEEFTSLLKDDGILFYPVYPQGAGLHYEFYKNLLNSLYGFLFNALGLPVTCCPVGRGDHGLPVGLQVVASPGCDHLTLAVAQELQEAFGGWVKPWESI